MAARRHSGRLTSTDAAFLYLERREAPMHIGAVCMLEGQLPFQDYVENIEAKLVRLPRFRERVMTTPLNLGHPTWESDPEFDIRNHVLFHRLEAPGNTEQLKELTGKIIAELLDRSRPLWELHVVHGLEDGNSAVISKVHHAMVDGVGGNAIMTTILDLKPDAEPPQREDDYEATEPATSRERVVEALWENARTALDSWSDYQRSLLDATRSINRDRVRDAMELVRTTMPELVLPPKRLPFNRHCGGKRRLTWTTFGFAEARAARAALGGTVNDLMLALVAGAVGRYCDEHGVDLRGRRMRVFVPVNVRPEAESGNLGNLVSGLPVEVPLDVEDPGHRVGLIRETTRVLKRGRVAEGINLASMLSGMVPPALQATVGSFAITPFPFFNMVCTNVPGPQIPLYGLGRPLRAYYPYVPVGFDMGVGCAIFSYNQTLFIGLNADLDACPDVERLRQAFDDEILAIKAAAGVGDIAPIDTFRRPAARPATARSRTAAPISEAEAAEAAKKSGGRQKRKKTASRSTKKAKKTKKKAKGEKKATARKATKKKAAKKTSKAKKKSSPKKSGKKKAGSGKRSAGSARSKESGPAKSAQSSPDAASSPN